MGSGGKLQARGARLRHRTAVTAADAAWVALIPWAVATVLAVVFLGPLLERVIFPPLHVQFLPNDPEPISPEPLENTRYLLLVLAAGALAALIVFTARRTLPCSARVVAGAQTMARVAGTGLVAVCMAAQHRRLWVSQYFDLRTLAAAGAIAAAVAVIAGTESLRARVTRLARAPKRVTRAALAISALTITAIWLMPAINSESSISWAFLYHDTAFHFDETFAVINGLTPLVNFNAQYASVFPYLVAVPMMAFTRTLLVFTISLCALSAMTLFAIYGVLRRAASSAVLGFVLYLPFMATSFFTVKHTALGPFSPATYFPMFPFRYGMPYLTAWLVARHLDGSRPAATWPLFTITGIALLNNMEFGVAAFAATLAALILTSEPTPRRLLHLAANALFGLGAAFAAFSAFTLIRAGSLPHVLDAGQFARLYAIAGYSSAPIPAVLGLPLVIYLTYVAAIAVGTVRATAHATNRTLTGMLVWAGVFGLGSGSYYVVRSVFGLLPMTFSAWTLALALLCIVAVRTIAARGLRRTTAPALAAIFGMAIAACSLAQAPAPWTQVQRIREPPADASIVDVEWAPRPSPAAAVRDFVSALASGPHRFVVRHGAPVAIFVTTGHRIADAYGVRDVVPFTGPESIHTTEELEASLDALEHAGGNTAIVGVRYLARLEDGLFRRGFGVLTDRGLQVATPGATLDAATIVVVDGYTKWVDMRHLRPAALRRS